MLMALRADFLPLFDRHNPRDSASCLGDRVMSSRNRRAFLADVGRGMLVASVGSSVAFDLGLVRSVHAAAADSRLNFGPLEPLVAQLQETSLDKLLPMAVGWLRSGTDLKTLVTAAALANARSFGGQDYIGYHTFMALSPAWHMAAELPSERAALPVLKVLYRNTQRIQDHGGRDREVLQEVAAAEPDPNAAPEQLREATRRADFAAAEARFAALAAGPPGEAYRHLQFAVEDEVDVHRVVLAWRAWAMLDLTGEEHAHTMLRQSVRYCANSERMRLDRKQPEPAIRSVLPRLLDEHRLLSRSLGDRRGEDAWLEELARTIYGSNREQAAQATATALAEGMSPASVGEAISLAANLLVLHDPGRRSQNAANKPVGSVHGDSVGVHASDSANAWRNIAGVSDHRNTVASLIVGAYHTAGQSSVKAGSPLPYAERLEKLQESEPDKLLQTADSAIRDRDQALASAAVHRLGELDSDSRPVFDLLLGYAVSEDGALHAEKYYRTVSEEFATARPAFRWRHLVALARVTASEFGYPAPGYQQARELLAS
jgi:hypothetical protein